jgi:hypothetical protein
MDRPTPPDDLPAYVTDPIARQDLETLETISEYVTELVAYRRVRETAPLDDEEITAEGEEILDVEESGSGTVVVKKIPCRKDCGGCPHGPYKYVVRREGDSLNWEYKGKVTE